MRPLSGMNGSKYRIIFSDIGGVLGTNGWDSSLRAKVITEFGLNGPVIEKRHYLMFDSYERGFLSLEQYLKYVFFDCERSFSLDALREFIFAGSIAWTDNIKLLSEVKLTNEIKLALISNEGQGITEHRVEKFGLRQLADFMVVSHCVHMRKPDAQIWNLALGLAQVTADQAIYIDDRAIFVEVAKDLGLTAFQHVSLEQTKQNLQQLGFQV